MTGNSNATSVTNDASLIIYTPPAGDPTQLASYKTLAMNYTGVGGTIQLNTFLGDDSAPSDRLVIDGGAGTGATKLDIRNTTGPGAETVANGILVVQATGGATTTPGAFALANGELRPGAFDYDLFRGGLNPSNLANDWFLRSSFVAPRAPLVAPPSGAGIGAYGGDGADGGPHHRRRRWRRASADPSVPFRSAAGSTDA